MIPYVGITEFTLGPVTLNVWGLAVASGILIALLVAQRQARRQGLPTGVITDLAIGIILAALIGARVFYVLNEWAQFVAAPATIWHIWDGGMAMYGGLIGGALAGWLFARWRKLPVARYADVIAFGLPLGIAIGRVGCWLIHDHLGSLTRLPWGQRLADGSIRHDVAVYEIVFCLALFGLFWLLRDKPSLRQRPGTLALLFIFLYGVFRFLADFLRATDLPFSDPVGWLGLHPSQWVALVSIIIAGEFLRRLMKVN